MEILCYYGYYINRRYYESKILHTVEKELSGEKKLKFSKSTSSLKCWMLEFVIGLKKG